MSVARRSDQELVVEVEQAVVDVLSVVHLEVLYSFLEESRFYPERWSSVRNMFLSVIGERRWYLGGSCNHFGLICDSITVFRSF